MKLLRIVPVEHKPGETCYTQGTQVLTPDGTPIHGVSRIVLIAETDDSWRAHIECLVEPPKMAEVWSSILYRREGFVRRWLRRMRGKELDVTTMSDIRARRYSL